MWIMLVKDLPVANAPMKLSIHYSWPWGVDKKQSSDKTLEYSESFKVYMSHIPFGCMEQDFEHARRIRFDSNTIRVFPDEYSKMVPEKLKLCVEEGYEFVSDPSLKDQFPQIVMTRNRKTIYDAALVDGCTEYEATMVCLGYDPSVVPPPLGWFKPPVEVINYFGVRVGDVCEGRYRLATPSNSAL